MSFTFLNQNNFKNRCSNGCVILANYKIAGKMKTNSLKNNNPNPQSKLQIVDSGPKFFGGFQIRIAIPYKINLVYIFCV